MKQTAPQTARELAYQVLCRVYAQGAYANLALKEALSGCPLSAQDRAFATELVYGTLRMRARLDHELAQLVSKGLDSLDPQLLVLLRLGLYQLEFAEVAPHAAVNESVALAEKYFHQGAAGLCNAVLRAWQRRGHELSFPDREKQPAQFLEAYYSYPRFMTGYFIKRWGLQGAENFCRFCNEIADVCIAVNTLLVSPGELTRQLRAEGIKVSPGKYLPECLYISGSGDIAALPAFRQGLFTVTEEGSALCAKALDPAPGSTVLDMCAAPGGKTVLMGVNMQNKGSIAAFDIHEHKAALIEQNARRMRLDCIKAYTADSRTLAGAYAEQADFLLLDAPCSGWGVLGRRADSRFNKRYEDIAELAALSYELLETAAKCLKPGGSMLFSTCTVTHEENEDNIARFLREHAEFAAEPMQALLPYAKTEAERDAMRNGMWQILPQEQKMEGFFLCRMKKRK